MVQFHYALRKILKSSTNISELHMSASDDRSTNRIEERTMRATFQLSNQAQTNLTWLEFQATLHPVA